jgi:hypothetical protein
MGQETPNTSASSPSAAVQTAGRYLPEGIVGKDTRRERDVVAGLQSI